MIYVLPREHADERVQLNLVKCSDGKLTIIHHNNINSSASSSLQGEWLD